MGILFTGATIIGLLLLIAGGIGLFITYTGFAWGSPEWVQGNLTYGTFTIIGVAILVLLVISGPEFE
ncbi:MAG: hypothetical protein ACE5LA_02045 [Dehalococcoidales bacterium]